MDNRYHTSLHEPPKLLAILLHDFAIVLDNISDIKRGQNHKAEATLLRTGPGCRGRGHNLEAEIEARPSHYHDSDC
jgi:hypothetical protein